MVYLVHDAFYQSRFTFAVFTDKSYFVSPFDGEGSIFEYYFVTIGFAYIIHNDRIITRSGRRWEFQPQCGGIFFVYFQQYQFLQHFHTALYL